MRTTVAFGAVRRWSARNVACIGSMALMLAVSTGAGCSGGSADTSPANDDSGAIQGRVTVFAAASLTEPFTRIGEDFEAAHPGTHVVLNFAGSSTLARQLNEGAPADVFASADPISMQYVSRSGGTAKSPAVFARNRLLIAVPAGNPHKVTGLESLADPGLAVAVCGEQVPCGRATKKALAVGGVTLVPTTFERDVKAVLAKLKLGEVDAGLVYRSDVRDAPELAGIEFPEAANAINDYPIVVLANAPNPRGAAAFVQHVLSEAGRAVLSEAGFEAP